MGYLNLQPASQPAQQQAGRQAGRQPASSPHLVLFRKAPPRWQRRQPHILLPQADAGAGAAGAAAAAGQRAAVLLAGWGGLASQLAVYASQEAIHVKFRAPACLLLCLLLLAALPRRPRLLAAHAHVPRTRLRLLAALGALALQRRGGSGGSCRHGSRPLGAIPQDLSCRLQRRLCRLSPLQRSGGPAAACHCRRPCASLGAIERCALRSCCCSSRQLSITALLLAVRRQQLCQLHSAANVWQPHLPHRLPQRLHSRGVGGGSREGGS